MDIFSFSSYREYILARVQAMPKGGRGQMGQISKHLRVHTSLLSQVLSGGRDFSLEQAHATCEYFGLNDLETEYFLALVHLERAGTPGLKSALKKQLKGIQSRAMEFKNRLPAGKELDEVSKGIYYSRWYYIAVWLMTDIEGHSTPEQISKSLQLNVKRVREALEFLVAVGLCKETEKGFLIQHRRTHIERESPLSARHHINWRLKIIEKLDRLKEHDTVFTAPLTISQEAAPMVQRKIQELVDEVSGLVSQSQSEALYCLNIDWLRVDEASTTE